MDKQWARFFMLLVRDAVAIALTLWLWQYTLQLGKPLGVYGIAVHSFTALATAFIGYLLHEWGHLLGAWGSRAAFELPKPFETFFLFRFDNLRSTRPQFFSMALGGFASSILTVIFLLLVLPSGVLATQIALTLTALGVLATFIIEVPEFSRVWRGGPIPNGAAFVHAGVTEGRH